MTLVTEKPVRFLRGIAERIPTYWTYMGESEGMVRFVAGVAYFSILCMAVAGLWAARRQPLIQLPVVFLLTMPIPFYLTWAVRGRFRFPIEPILILFAAYAVTSLLSRAPRPSLHSAKD